MDQRCHGRSLGLAKSCEPSTVADSAADLGRFLDRKLANARLDVLLGHSLGGKVVLDLLQQRQEHPPCKQVTLRSSASLKQQRVVTLLRKMSA